MIRFVIFYIILIILRALRLGIPLTGDTNYLASPIGTVAHIMRHPCVTHRKTLVDVGCGEGIAGLFMRLMNGYTLIGVEHMAWFRRIMAFMCRLLMIRRVECHATVPTILDPNSVFFCVWVSWSLDNREGMIQTFVDTMPVGAALITVGHPMTHPHFGLVHRTILPFAWGDATVYYYTRDSIVAAEKHFTGTDLNH